VNGKDAAQTDQEICRLCKNAAALQNSHIIPAFVFKWLKSGGAGHIRHTANINRRVQDGATRKLLCADCEARFNGWETRFSNEIFNPFCYGGALPSIAYGDWLLKFCVSVSWRSLIYIRSDAEFSHYTAKQLDLVERASEVWAEFLLGRRKNPGQFEQHLIPFGPITNIAKIKFPPNINRYLLRMIEIDAGANFSTAFIFSKLGRLGLLGFIDLKKPEQWEGSKVRLRGGRLSPRVYGLPVQFGDYLASRAQRVWDAQAKTSPTQKNKIETAFLNNLDAFANSQLREAVELDIRLFGDAALNRDATT
jgi:hypothetical protein